jgi:hypothetical protein
MTLAKQNPANMESSVGWRMLVGYDILIDHKNKIVLCAAEGKLNIELAASMTKDARKQAFELGCKTLYYDVMNASLSVGILDAYHFPRDIENIYEDRKRRSSKAAILYGPDKDRRF